VYRYHRQTNPGWAATIDAERAKWAKVREHRAAPEADDSLTTPTTFAEFVGRYFPDRRPHMEHQLRIAAELAQLRPREVCMFLIWPEAGKTATLEDYICRKLAFDKGHRFRYVSEAADLSKRVIGTVQRRFTDESEYGPFIKRYALLRERSGNAVDDPGQPSRSRSLLIRQPNATVTWSLLPGRVPFTVHVSTPSCSMTFKASETTTKLRRSFVVFEERSSTGGSNSAP